MILAVLLCVTAGYSQSGKCRSGIFLHHSTGYNYRATGTANTVPSEVTKYNSEHGYSGDNAITFKRQGFPSSGDNEWYRWHMLFENPNGYDGEQAAGVRTFHWNAIDNNGNNISSGLYYLRFEAITSSTGQHFVNVGKIFLIR